MAALAIRQATDLQWTRDPSIGWARRCATTGRSSSSTTASRSSTRWRSWSTTCSAGARAHGAGHQPRAPRGRRRGRLHGGSPRLADGGAADDPEAVGRASAVRLFVDHRGPRAPTSGWMPSRAPLVAALCRRLDGLPLALELAATLVPSLGLAEVVARLGDRFGLLGGRRRGGPPGTARSKRSSAGAGTCSTRRASGPAAAGRPCGRLHPGGGGRRRVLGGRPFDRALWGCSPGWSTGLWSSPPTPTPVPATTCSRRSPRMRPSASPTPGRRPRPGRVTWRITSHWPSAPRRSSTATTSSHGSPVSMSDRQPPSRPRHRSGRGIGRRRPPARGRAELVLDAAGAARQARRSLDRALALDSSPAVEVFPESDEFPSAGSEASPTMAAVRALALVWRGVVASVGGDHDAAAHRHAGWAAVPAIGDPVEAARSLALLAYTSPRRR